MLQSFRKIFHKEISIVISILLLALINGLIYVFILPPWQHYDEPNHFEYVWLLANRERLPQPGDYDSAMRQAVAQSMILHRFFVDTDIPLPDLTAENPWIGQYPQLDDPPFYYFLASLPVRFLASNQIDIQLYAARLVSLILFLTTILAGWGLVAEITPPRHPLRFLVPTTMALLPAFVDLMTAVNNDVGAIALFSLFLWGSVRLIRRGPSLWTLLWVLGTAGLCLITKRTVYLAIPLLGVALLFAFLRGSYRKIAWGLVVALVLVVLFSVFAWGDAALWYRDTTQRSPTRVYNPGLPAGKAAFRLMLQPGVPSERLVQIIPVEIASEMSGKPHTLGAWIWAEQPMEINSPQVQVYEGNQRYGQTISIDETPRFYAFTFTPQGNTRRTWVALEPGINPGSGPSIHIFFDGLVLAEGSYPLDGSPAYDQGIWGVVPFENLLRNGSAEFAWFYLRPWADELGAKIFPDAGQDQASLMIYALFDQPSTSWYHRRVAESLFRTFWAKFAWGHVSLLGAKPYRVLLVFTFIALSGVGLKFWLDRRKLLKYPCDALFLLSLALFSVWGLAFVRGSNYIFLRAGFVPAARYAFPAIIPTILVLCAGWLTWLIVFEKRFLFPPYLKYVIFAGFWIALNVYSLWSIYLFYG